MALRLTTPSISIGKIDKNRRDSDMLCDHLTRSMVKMRSELAGMGPTARLP